MKKLAVIIAAFCLGVTFLSLDLQAAGDLTKQQPIQLSMQLGNEKNEIRFFPSEVEFETGKLYRLVLHNPSPQKHYFSSEGLSRSVYTRKVQVNDKGGIAIAEVKGNVREIEVYPGGTAEWWFVPVKIGKFSDLECTIKGHTEAGMVGKITIK